jgi:outer membrane protein, heavy metal efflux system
MIPPFTRALALLLLTGVVLAQAPAESNPTSLDQLLARANQRTAVQGAERALVDARATLQRTEADPLALRLDRLGAAQDVELARAELRSEQFAAMAEVATAWTRVRETALQLALSEAALELAERALLIAEVRLVRGSATNLDVEEARTGVQEAETNLFTVRNGLALTLQDLRGLSGLPGPFDLQAVDRGRLDAPLPATNTLTAAVENLPTLLRVKHGAELAAVAVDLLDPSFASRAQIEAAASQSAQAAAGVREARRGLTLRIQSLLDQVSSARERDRIARDSLAQAGEREAIETRRFEAGLIAEVALMQVQLSTKQAELAAISAEHALMLALLDLQAGTLVTLEGWGVR